MENVEDSVMDIDTQWMENQEKLAGKKPLMIAVNDRKDMVWTSSRLFRLSPLNFRTLMLGGCHPPSITIELKPLPKIGNGFLQPCSQVHLRLPAELLLGPRNIRSTNLGIVLRKRAELDGAFASNQLSYEPSQVKDRNLLRIPEIHGIMDVRIEQAHNPLDHVRDIAKAPRLRTVPMDREGLIMESLNYERRHCPTIVNALAGAVGVKNTENPRIKTVGEVVGHRHSLGEPLCLIVDAARTNWVHIPPVLFWLRVDQGIAVHFGGRREEKSSPLRFGQA